MMMSEWRQAAPGRHMSVQHPYQRSTCQHSTWHYRTCQRRPCRCQLLCEPLCPYRYRYRCCCRDGDGSDGGNEDDEDGQDDDDEEENEE